MTYQQTIEYLYQLTPAFEKIGAAAYKPGLGNMLRLMQALGNPHRDLKTIHVAGTNGKGSTSHMLAAILQSEGYTTGLYTSPHLVDFAERIRVGGQMIDHRYVIDFVRNNEALVGSIRPSFFELATAMAFCYFRDMGTDICVIETGLGGRLDSTNVITPLLSVITNIGLDHTAQLGGTLPLIASEKAGIIKQGVPVVVGEHDETTDPVFLRVANEQQAPIIFAEDEPLQPVVCQLEGQYQQHNIATVLAAVGALRQQGVAIGDDALEYGLAHVCDLTGLKGRWQVMRHNPLVVCDTGHNAHGLRYVARQLLTLPRPLNIVFGMVADKDIEQSLRLMPQNAQYFFTQPDSLRALPAAELAAIAQRCGLNGTIYTNAYDAFSAALHSTPACGSLFVGGSNYLVGSLLGLM